MMETVIVLKPHEQWRHVDTWYSDWAPGWLRPVLRRLLHNQTRLNEMVGVSIASHCGFFGILLGLAAFFSNRLSRPLPAPPRSASSHPASPA